MTSPQGGPDDDAPASATGAQTLLDVLEAARARGFGVHLFSRPRGRVECTACGRLSDAAKLVAERVHRLEGASDAADLLLVVEAACPRCREGGALTLGYGPNTSRTDERVLARLDLGGG